jgi:signal transduction histidine kinase
MDGFLDRRLTFGRRDSDGQDLFALRGLMHDLEHGMATVAFLVEGVRGDPGLPTDAIIRLGHVDRELARLHDVVTNWAAGPAGAVFDGGSVNVRQLVDEVVGLAEAEYGTTVVLLPGPAVSVPIRPELLWRILANIVHNAARAAGPHGTVEVTVERSDVAVIEVSDDGPGFGNGLRGTSSLGLTVITSLLRSVGARLEVRPRHRGGTVVRVVIPVADDAGSAGEANLDKVRQG